MKHNYTKPNHMKLNYTKLSKKAIIGLLMASTLLAGACGGSGDTTDDDAAALSEDAVLGDAAVLDDDVEVSNDSAEEVEDTEQVDSTEPVDEFDMVAAVNAYTSTIPEGFMAIKDVAAFKDAMAAGDPLLIDVREINEYEEGHIEGAANIPLRTVSQNIDKIPIDRQVIIYCTSGFRAGMATSSLRLLGYDNVVAYAPGWKGWTAAGEPVSTDVFEAEVVGVPDVAPEMLSAVNGFLTTLPEGWLSAGDPSQVEEAINAGAFILDVRTVGENTEGFIPGSVNVPLRSLATSFGEIPTDTQVITYCTSGFRSALSIPVLYALGYDNVKGFPGSWKAWTEAGMEVATP